MIRFLISLKPVEVFKNRNSNYNITLYSIHNSGRRYYIGEIMNAECITKEKSKEIYNLYRNNG